MFDKVSVSVQTERIFSCHKCDFQVDDVYEFDMHRWTEHEDDDELDTRIHVDVEKREASHNWSETNMNDFECNFCDKNFRTKRAVMEHKKNEHREKVANCWKFADGICQQSDAKCWFNHLISDNEPTIIKCHLCEKSFKTFPNFLKHKRENHTELVQKCRNALTGTCSYGEKLCWFKHESIEELEELEKSKNYNQEVFDKIFVMMDKITERIVNVEAIQ